MRPVRLASRADMAFRPKTLEISFWTR